MARCSGARCGVDRCYVVGQNVARRSGARCGVDRCYVVRQNVARYDVARSSGGTAMRSAT